MAEMRAYWVEVPHDPEDWQQGGSDCIAEFPGTVRGYEDAKKCAGEHGRSAYVVEATFEYTDSELVASPQDCGSVESE